MPLTSPLPAELAFGQPTRESLTGVADPLSFHKDQAEREWIDLLMRFWAGQLARIEARLRARLPDESPGKAIAMTIKARRLPTPDALLPDKFWREETKALLALLAMQLRRGAMTAATMTAARLESIGITLDWTLINVEASTWARRYAGELVKGINKTTRAAVGEAVGSWIETPEATIGDLFTSIRNLGYPERRARLIAVTEVTRSYTQGTIATAREGERWGVGGVPLFRYFKVWQTNNDSLVCGACLPMHLKEVERTAGEFMTPAGASGGPPLHPNCRCWVTFRVEAITKEEARRRQGHA